MENLKFVMHIYQSLVVNWVMIGAFVTSPMFTTSRWSMWLYVIGLINMLNVVNASVYWVIPLIPIYISIGIMWSVVKYKMTLTHYMSTSDGEYAPVYSPSGMTEFFKRWAITWPVDCIAYAAFDIKSVISKRLVEVYTRIYVQANEVHVDASKK